MSGTTTPPPTSSSLMIWGAIIVSVSVAISFFGALVYSYISKDQPNAALLVNSVVINMSRRRLLAGQLLWQR